MFPLIMKSAILLFFLGSLGLPAANAADYGSEHQGFVKIQQALDYAGLQLVVNKALEQLRLFQKVRFIVIQDPSVVSVKDDDELAKRLETFHRFCASGGLISFIDDRKGSVVCRIFMGWSAEEGFESRLKSSVADMSVVRPVLHVSLNRLRPDTANPAQV